MKRNKNEWIIDALGLLQQGIFFPIIQVYGLSLLLNYLFPNARGVIKLHWSLSFLIQFVLIDYLYYWNHRLLHIKNFWKFHRIHHCAKGLDLWVTSRNSFWSSFLILYLWIHSVCLFLLDDSRGFLWAISIGSSLDLWRHSKMRLPGAVENILGNALVLPRDHELHHSNSVHDTNFGANFILWDKWHGTYLKKTEECHEFGEDIKDSFWNQWLFPWRLKP